MVSRQRRSPRRRPCHRHLPARCSSRRFRRSQPTGRSTWVLDGSSHRPIHPLIIPSRGAISVTAPIAGMRHRRAGPSCRRGASRSPGAWRSRSSRRSTPASSRRRSRRRRAADRRRYGARARRRRQRLIPSSRRGYAVTAGTVSAGGPAIIARHGYQRYSTIKHDTRSSFASSSRNLPDRQRRRTRGDSEFRTGSACDFPYCPKLVMNASIHVNTTPPSLARRSSAAAERRGVATRRRRRRPRRTSRFSSRCSDFIADEHRLEVASLSTASS